jgi:23S rRNA pseudoU1915 N3-methylase RlmH
MHENPEMHVSSAKQLMELNQKREKEAQRIQAAENSSAQLVALQKESNELARKALDQVNDESNKTDVIDLKPNIFGIGLNLNEAWRKFGKWISK